MFGHSGLPVELLKMAEELGMLKPLAPKKDNRDPQTRRAPKEKRRKRKIKVASRKRNRSKKKKKRK